MTLQIAPSLPASVPPPAGQAAPAEPDEQGGFARLLQAQTGHAAAPVDETAVLEETPPLPAPADETETTATAVDPSLAHWLAALHLPAAPESRAAGTALAGRTPAEDVGEALAAPAAAPAAAGRPAGARGLPERGGAEPRSPGPRGDMPGAGVTGVTGAPGAPPRENNAPAAPAEHEPAARIAPVELPPAGPVATTAAAPAAPAAPAAAAPGPVDVALPMAPGDDGFEAAFATQVSVLARDGVQQAELHLNPAETGPVSVQIVLEGTQARIDFGADALPTRQAIEGSLPELAAALREQGLTLSGGGVSEHARGRQEPPAPPGGGPARRAGSTDEGAAAPARPLRIARSAGGLDLYA